MIDQWSGMACMILDLVMLLFIVNLTSECLQPLAVWDTFPCIKAGVCSVRFAIGLFVVHVL